MIEVTSHPPDLGNWDQEEHPFYFELYGETEPKLDMTFAEVLPAGNDAATSVATTPIYEYWWTLGHSGTAPEHHHLWPGRKDEKPIWQKLDDIAAHVYLYFPINAGWRIKELVATVKYLSPVADQKTWTAAAAAEWSKLQPFMQDAGTLASTLAPIPGAGTVAAGAAPILSTLAKLQIGSVPQGVKGFDWSVGKVTFGSKKLHGVMQGVMWTLPREMFEIAGWSSHGESCAQLHPQSESVERRRPVATAIGGHSRPRSCVRGR